MNQSTCPYISGFCLPISLANRSHQQTEADDGWDGVHTEGLPMDLRMIESEEFLSMERVRTWGGWSYIYLHLSARMPPSRNNFKATYQTVGATTTSNQIVRSYVLP
ncbi:hypothetical protein ACFE04_013156 [Oxalis oulophora]